MKKQIVSLGKVLDRNEQLQVNGGWFNIEICSYVGQKCPDGSVCLPDGEGVLRCDLRTSD